MVNESIKQYVVLAVTKYDTVPNGYYGHKMKVFHARGQALEYLNAMNTASQY
jgi:GTPase SAR1 family protein